MRTKSALLAVVCQRNLLTGESNLTTVLITGATSGIGMETAIAMARLGNRVVLGARDAAKADKVAMRIRSLIPGAEIEASIFDLGDLSSIAAAANTFDAPGRQVDILINNAGVMALPLRMETRDGFEMQLGINHLGHFALAAALAKVLERSKNPRVVTVSSVMHQFGRINFNDLNSALSYSPWGAYCQSKLANLHFTIEMGRRANMVGSKLVFVGAHPGYSATNLVGSGPMMGSKSASLVTSLQRVVAQSAAAGATSVVLAATAKTVNGSYFGPGGLMQLRGRPRIVRAAKRAYDTQIASQLMTVSEQMTGVSFPF